MASFIDYPDGSHALGTAPLWQGRVKWTHDEDSLEYIDVDPLPIYADESVVLVARNSSPTVDMVVNVGQLVYGFPTGAAYDKTWVCTAATATDLVLFDAHGLAVGDAVTPVASARGLTAGTVYYVVGADHETDIPDADSFYLSTARGSESLANITGDDDDVTVTLTLVPEFAAYTSFTVPKFAAASSTAPIDGCVSKNIGSFGRYGGRLMVEKSAATAGVCTCYLAIYRG